MSSEFTGISGVEAWAKKLDELLGVAEQAAESDDGAARRDIRTRLKEFILHSRPESPEIRMLDAIASETRTALAMESITERLEAIAGRSSDLARLIKEFQTRTEEGRSRANLITLEPARKVVATTTAAIQALKELQAELSVEQDEALLRKISQVLSRLQSLRSEIESA
jgi:hypothetical protein